MLQWIQEERPGFGLDFHICVDLVLIKTINVNVALYSINLVNDVGLSIAVKVAKDNSFMQYAKATNRSAECDFLSYTQNIVASVNRASYGQLIEGGPLPLPASQNFLRKSGRNILRVCNPSLGTHLLAALKTMDSSSTFRI